MIRAYVFPDNRDNERDRGIRSNVRCNREGERESAIDNRLRERKARENERNRVKWWRIDIAHRMKGEGCRKDYVLGLSEGNSDRNAKRATWQGKEMEDRGWKGGRWKRETESVVSQDGIRWKPAGLVPLPVEFPASVITSFPILSNSGRTASTFSLSLDLSIFFFPPVLPSSLSLLLARRPFPLFIFFLLSLPLPSFLFLVPLYPSLLSSPLLSSPFLVTFFARFLRCYYAWVDFLLSLRVSPLSS